MIQNLNPPGMSYRRAARNGFIHNPSPGGTGIIAPRPRPYPTGKHNTRNPTVTFRGYRR